MNKEIESEKPLIEQVREAVAKKSDAIFKLTLRYKVYEDVKLTKDSVRKYQRKFYGPALSCIEMKSGDPDGLGEIDPQKEIAFVLEYRAADVLRHLEKNQ